MFEKQKSFAKKMQNENHKQPWEFTFNSTSYNLGYWAGYKEGVKAAERAVKKGRI